jgi:hypothetical protein
MSCSKAAAGSASVTCGWTLRHSMPSSSIPTTVRQPFNDTDADQLWLIVSAPPEPASTADMSEEDLRFLYPDGPKALPPELES